MKQGAKKPTNRTDEFSKQFLHDEDIDESYGQSKGTYGQYPTRHPNNAQSQRNQEAYLSDPRQALGGGDYEDLKSKYSTDGKMLRSKRSPTGPESNSSDGSDITHQTAYQVNKRGAHLTKLTRSRASLLKTLDEGMSGVQQGNYCSDLDKHNPRDTYRCEREQPKAGTSSSAGLINEKIIHPMIKKFRLLYLHNIKEEVSIMEDLEMLPHKLDEVCKTVERR